MRRILLFGLLYVFGVLALQADPWGSHKEDHPRAKHTKPNHAFHILRTLSSGKPVKIFLAFETENLAELRQGYENELWDAYSDWFAMTRSYIRKTGEEKNFLQMLLRLQKGTQVQFVSSLKKADLHVFIAAQRETVQAHCVNKEKINFSVEACVSWEEEMPSLYMPAFSLLVAEMTQHAKRHSIAAKQEQIEHAALNYFSHVLRHEIGHTLGLADQYQKAIPEATSHRMYRSTHIRDGIMNEARDFTCDDADGIVNLIDVVHGTERNRKQGWHSLCPDSPDVYIDGVAQGTGPYKIGRDKGALVLTTYSKNGEKKKEKKLSILSMPDPLRKIPDVEILEQDGFNRPVKTKGPAGEIIYYVYNYSVMDRIITKNGKALRWEYYQTEETNQEGKLETVRYVQWDFRLSDGQMGVIYLLLNKNDVLAYYKERPEGTPRLTIEVKKKLDAPEHVIIHRDKGPQSEGIPTLEEKIEQLTKQQEIDALVQRFKAWIARQQREWPSK